MPRRGRAFERLIEALHRLAAQDPKLRIQSPAFLPDKITGARREIDLLLSYGSGNAVTRIAVECKDHSRPIDVKEIEAFTGKVADLAVDQAVMVSSSGYTGPAVLKAAARGLVVQTVEQSERYDWTHTAGVLQDWVNFTSLETQALVNGRWIPCKRLFNSIGVEITLEHQLDAIGAALLSDPLDLERTEDEHTKRPNDLLIDLDGVATITEFSGTRVAAPRCRARAVVHFSREFQTLGYFQNRTEGAGRPTAFGRATLGGANEFSELVMSEIAPGRAALIVHDHSAIATTARGHISLVTWEDLHGRLMEVQGLRHHINLSEASDFVSVAKFMHYFDPSSGNTPYQPDEDSWPREVTGGGAATVAVRVDDIPLYRRPKGRA